MENDKNKARWDELNLSKETALHYMKTLAEVAREPLIILDVDLRVVAANSMFYDNFKVVPAETEDKLLYQLGNGQWNIPELRKLLEEILPKQKIVKNYEVVHVFETIGKKMMLLNARQIDSVQLIILVIEDISARKLVEENLAEKTKELAAELAEKTKRLAAADTATKKMVKDKLAENTKELAAELAEKTKKLTNRVKELEGLNKAKKVSRKSKR